MPRDDFGNLEEWGRVLSELAKLAQDRVLDEHQDGLVRLLRYPDNWRLREAALEATGDVKHPSEALISTVLGIMANESLYHEVRMLAAEALARLIVATRSSGDARHRELEQQVTEQMHALLDSPHPPILRQAVQRVLPTIE
ncbi:MAG: hypothetical protein JW910_23760 [Anaerolineae bacterium]|nr:hypothetical protein [Anaerolineae bacterium]